MRKNLESRLGRRASLCVSNILRARYLFETKLQYEARWFVKDVQNVESLKFVNVAKSLVFRP